jgi:plasmid maintenance system antidote protein VapI
MTQEALALRLDITLKHANEIINEKTSLTPEMAIRLELVF